MWLYTKILSGKKGFGYKTRSKSKLKKGEVFSLKSDCSIELFISSRDELSRTIYVSVLLPSDLSYKMCTLKK